MLSKLSRNLSSRTSGNLGLQIHNNQSMVKASLTHRTINLKKTSPSHRKIRVMGKKKDTGKWCDFHKIPWHNTDECRSKQSLVVELKEIDSSPNLDSDSENNKRRQIIDVEPTATIMTTTIQPEEPEDPEEGECLFHSHMWVKGTSLHFIVDSRKPKEPHLKQRSSSSCIFRQHHTRNHTTLYGFTKDEIFVSASSVTCPMTSSPSRMRYCVMFPHWKYVMLC
jgi:hypothetical protein